MKLVIEQVEDKVQVSGDGVTVTFDRATWDRVTPAEILAAIRDEIHGSVLAEHAVAFQASDPVLTAGVAA